MAELFKMSLNVSFFAKGLTIMDGWIKKGGATPDRSRTPARGPLFEPNVLP
jgi:hypothetical protein